VKPLPRPVPQKLEPLTAPFAGVEIDDATLDRLSARIKPLIPNKDDDGHLYYIEPTGRRSIAYTWDPKPTEKAEGLEPLTTIRTLHTFSYHGFFKPSIAEVLAAVQRLPAEFQDKVVAFHLTGPGYADDLNHEKEALDAGFQVAYATLYTKAG
jgi:hypothetical protein